MLNFQALSRCTPFSSDGRNDGGEVIMPWVEQAEENRLSRLRYLRPVAATMPVAASMQTWRWYKQRAVGEVFRPDGCVFQMAICPPPPE
jgi:hypothetical protein